MEEKKLIVNYKYFRGSFATWPALFDKAADFASMIGKEKLISISHSEDRDDGVVTVWFWTEAES